jgi:hypothetical protein
VAIEIVDRGNTSYAVESVLSSQSSGIRPSHSASKLGGVPVSGEYGADDVRRLEGEALASYSGRPKPFIELRSA